MRRSLHPAVSAVLVGAPSIAAALVAAALEAGRVFTPDDPLFGPPRPVSFATALLRADLESAFGYIRDGQDPNATVTLRMPGRPQGELTSLQPIVLAVASGNADTVRMLLGAGVNMDLPDNRLALCLAREAADASIERLLVHAAPGPVVCPDHVLPR